MYIFINKCKKYMWVYIVGAWMSVVLETIMIFISQIQMDLSTYCEGGSMIPVFFFRQNVKHGSMIELDHRS